MFLKEPESFLARIRHALTLPIATKCAELTVLLDRGSIMELQGVFSCLIEDIFGPQGSVSWGLRSTPENMSEAFRQIHHFLSPCGPLFKLIYTLLKDPCTKYDFPLGYLPSKVRQLLENAQCHPFYSDLVQINPQTKQVVSLRLNPFDYYMFHFAYHLINPWHQRTAPTINLSWNTVYYVLCCDYVLHFLPTDPNTPVLPIINYNGKNPMQSPTPVQRAASFSPLLSSSILNKTVEDYSFQNLERHPRNDIWRSETVLTVFIDMWLNNDLVRQPNNQINNYLNSPQVSMQLLYYNELPTGEYMRIVRVFIKQVHTFAQSAKADDTHLGELKKISLTMIQAKFYIFIRNLVHRWPLDGSFRLVLELWLTYIQPWRYPPTNINRHLNSKPTNPDAEDVNLQQSQQITLVDREYLPFIVENLLTYVVIFQQLLPRFSRVDLVSPKMAVMLYRITKVFDQPNLPSLLREVERCVENNHSPSHSYNSQWSNNLPPLSPTSNWSTNSALQARNQGTPPKQVYSSEFVNATYSPLSSIYQEKKWAGAVRQKIYELEGPNFCYKSLFSNPPADEVFDLIHLIKKSIVASQEIVQVKQMEEAKNYAGFLGFFRHMFETPSLNDEFTLNERMKVPSYLEFSLENLMDLFQITEIQERETDQTQCPSSNNFDLSDDFKFLTPSRVRERIKKIKYEGDPDLHPIRSTENTFLVRVLYQLAQKINDEFGGYFLRMYSQPTFKGRLWRQLLCEPITVFNYDKTKPGSPRVARRLPPRVSFRKLASYQFLFYFMLGGLIALFLGYSSLSYVFVLVFFFFIYKCIKAIPRRHMYPTEGFCNIIFNDSF